jgi:ubiquinone/menaquinone biosynthesis C-methylase UbiE
MSSTSSSQENPYVMDAESAAETARLLHLERLVTQEMGGSFPSQLDLSHVHTVLDLACGPGGWVLDVARSHPEMEVAGIDISETTIRYAHAQVQAQKVSNASFEVMDLRHPLEFSDQTFDLVNARFLSGFMTPSTWPVLLQECRRITRPGGYLRLTECEEPGTNSKAFETIYGLILQAMKRSGQGYSPDGRRTGITPLLTGFLRQGGYQGIEKMAYALDCSVDTSAYTDFYHNYMVGFRLIEPFLLRMKVTTEEAFESLYQQVLAEMRADSFQAIWFLLSVWGTKLDNDLQ